MHQAASRRTIARAGRRADCFRRPVVELEGSRGWQQSPVVHDGPNKFAAEVHDRMPVVLEAKDFEQWEIGDAKDAAAR